MERGIAALSLVALLLVGCGGGTRSPYVRVVDTKGRMYYAETSRALYTEAGGFVTFVDLVTGEEVRLTNGRYSALPCTVSEVDKAQSAYIQNPTKVPSGTFNGAEGQDPSIWR
ncbi:MAG: hypothetical protein ACYTGZ_04615 [Planctomycetota bacterium]|jgi:hypothetical protein